MRFLFLSILLQAFIMPCFAQGGDSAAMVSAKNSDTIISVPAAQKIFAYKNDTLVFDKPNLLHNLANTPSDLWQIARSPFKRESLLPLAAVATSTAILIWQDQNILNGVRKLSDNIGLNPSTEYGDLITIGKTKVYRYPKNLNTAFYQLGQGGTSMLLAGGIWIFGKCTHDQRAVSTAYDITETFVTMAVTTQILKRVSGRESPFERTASGGSWHPFPSFAAFQKHTSRYDAFPSGHLATLVATITVLANNYPEKKWIVPVGCAVAGACAFAMMNTEVHWAGDYPLAIAIGYLSGKITTWRHKKNAPRIVFIP